MPGPERMPTIVGGITLVVGGALLGAPRLASGPLGLRGEERALRGIGAADLSLVPGLLAGRPRWRWMAARAALDVAQAAALWRLAARAGDPGRAQVAAATLLGLTAADGFTALALRRASG
jgi:hypothetical protein